MADDIENPNLGELDWAENSRAESLTKVYDHAMSVSTAAQNWYAGKHPSKRTSGRALRLTGILLAGVGALLPIISEISSSSSGKPAIAPGWAAVALGLAAGCGILDRYLGFSSAWMRFILAEQHLERQRRDFEYQWNQARAKLSVPPSADDVEKMLTLARDNVKQVEEIILRETADWVTEFRGALAEAERSLAVKHN
jgi:SMODS and SLOG-associating 2TM effector domain 2